MTDTSTSINVGEARWWLGGLSVSARLNAGSQHHVAAALSQLLAERQRQPGIAFLSPTVRPKAGHVPNRGLRRRGRRR